MASSDNRLRRNWQTLGNSAALKNEKNIKEVLDQLFMGTPYEVEYQPKIFKDVYSQMELSVEEQAEIYNVDVHDLHPRALTRYGEVAKPKQAHWGWQPDFLVRNVETGKQVFFEVKRQDGWVEGGVPSDGRGNAHERALKHFSAGILEMERRESGITDPDFLPFVMIYVGDITRDPKRVREIMFAFGPYQDNHYLWRTRDRNGNATSNGGELRFDDLAEYIIEKVIPHLN